MILFYQRVKDKLRLSLLYIISCDGISESELNQIYTCVPYDRSDLQAITNLSTFGIKLSPRYGKEKSEVFFNLHIGSIFS